MAKEAGAAVVVVTDKPSALLAPYASVLITVPVDSSTFFNSMVAPQFAAEILLDVISHRAIRISICGRSTGILASWGTIKTNPEKFAFYP